MGKKAKTRRYSDLKLSGPAADLLKAAVSKQSAAPVEAKFPFESMHCICVPKGFICTIVRGRLSLLCVDASMCLFWIFLCGI